MRHCARAEGGRSGSPEEPGGRQRADRRATEQHQQGLRFLPSLLRPLLIPGWERAPPASREGGGSRPGFWGPEKGKDFFFSSFCHDLVAASLRLPALLRGVLRRTQTQGDLDVSQEGKGPPGTCSDRGPHAGARTGEWSWQLGQQPGPWGVFIAVSWPRDYQTHFLIKKGQAILPTTTFTSY